MASTVPTLSAITNSGNQITNQQIQDSTKLIAEGAFGCVYDYKLKCDISDPKHQQLNELHNEQDYVSRISLQNDLEQCVF